MAAGASGVAGYGSFILAGESPRMGVSQKLCKRLCLMVSRGSPGACPGKRLPAEP